MSEQITRENWEQSENKWVRIVKKTRNKENFLNHRGFADLDVVRRCGYCFQFPSYSQPCCTCPLYQKGICSNEIRGDFMFDKYLTEMQKRLYGKKVNWKKAFDHAIKILAAIREDEPPKEPV